jgi:hypothetical protein
MMMVSVSRGSLRTIKTILEAEFLMVGGTKDKLVSSRLWCTGRPASSRIPAYCFDPYSKGGLDGGSQIASKLIIKPPSKRSTYKTRAICTWATQYIN